MRLAFFTPLNPIQSGISDYSEELLPLLGRAASVDVFIDRYKATRSDFGPGLRVLRATDFGGLQRRQPYDEILYQMGNSPAHAYIYDEMMRTPGVAVLHEFVLHHLRMWMALRRGKGKAYLREMTAIYGEVGRSAAERVLLGQHPEALFEFPLVEAAIQQAKGIIVHSPYMAGRVREVRPNVPLALVNMGVPLPPYIPRLEARARLGIDQDMFIISSLGHLNPYKRLNIALRAFKAFAMNVPRSRMLLVGSRSPNFDVDRLIGMLGMRDRVEVIGFAPQDKFQDYVAASDVCINLRFPTAGETSAALLRIMGAGKPVLVSDIGSFGDLPDDAVAKVDVGGVEEQLLLEYFLLLARDTPLRLAMGRAARRYVAQEHTLEGAAASYLRFLDDLRGSSTDLSAFALPSYAAEDWPLRELAASSAIKTVQVAVATAPQEVAAEPVTPLAVLAEAAADLGLSESDPNLAALLRKIAAVL